MKNLQMIRTKTLRLLEIRTFPTLRSPSSLYVINPKPHPENHSVPSFHTKSLIPTSSFTRNISLSSRFQHEFATEEANEKLKKPLEAVFEEAVGLSKSDFVDEREKLKKSLRKLEVELRSNKNDSAGETDALFGMFSKPLETIFAEAVGLSENGRESGVGEIKTNDQESKKGLKKLSSLFRSTDQREISRKESPKVEEPLQYKELSPEMALFANHLHKKGYLMKANFLPKNMFDVSGFENNYSRDFLKFAAERFAMDNREIYKCLPSGDLKMVAQFGCPSVGRKTVFSAKAMRFVYGIQEETVCSKCMLKESCKFMNQSVWKKGAKNVDLAVVMRVVVLYALDMVPTELEVPDDIKNAVNRLLKEVFTRSDIES